MSVIIDSFGGNGGTPFAMEAIHVLGLRSKRLIDAVNLNEVAHGGNGGDEGSAFQFAEDEYITDVTIRHGSLVDALAFQTNKGKNISGGGSGGHESTLNNIRILGIGGNSGEFLDKIRIKYLDNYTPSVQVEDSTAVIGVVAPGASIERFTSNQVQTVVGHTKVMEQVFTLTTGVETKALGEFIAKLTASGELKSTTREEIRDEVTVIEQNSVRTTFTPGPDRVGLEMVPVHVFVDTDTNFFWISPIGIPTIISVRQDADRLNANVYDLTRILGIQIPTLLPRRTQRNGFNFYQME